MIIKYNEEWMAEKFLVRIPDQTMRNDIDPKKRKRYEKAEANQKQRLNSTLYNIRVTSFNINTNIKREIKDLLMDFKSKIEPHVVREILEINPNKSSYTDQMGKNLIDVYFKTLDKAHDMLQQTTKLKKRHDGNLSRDVSLSLVE